MHLPFSQLGAHLAQPLHPLYVVHGDEPLLAQEAQDAIRAAARDAGHAERSVHTVMGAHFDWSAPLAAGQSLSLFAQKQIVEIRIPSGKPGKEGSAALQQLAAQIAGQAAQATPNAPGPGVLTLITLPRLDKAAKTSPWFTALEAAGVCVQTDPIDRARLPAWIAERMARQGQRVPAGEEGQQALRFFADRVEGNLLAAHQEISKLALLYPPGEVSRAQIEAAVLNVARYDVFKLSEAMLAGQRDRVQKMLDGLQAEGEAEVLVHYAIAEDIRTLKRVQDAAAAGRPLPLALREARVWGQRERLIERALPGLPAAQLASLLQAAHFVDGICKGLPAPGWPADAWLALRRLAQGLTAACAAACRR